MIIFKKDSVQARNLFYPYKIASDLSRRFLALGIHKIAADKSFRVGTIH